MTPPRLLFAASLLAFFPVLVTRSAEAKRTGMNLACPNCHEGQTKPTVAATLSAPRVEPGTAVTITITATHPTAKVGGVLVDSKSSGKFELVDAVGTHLFEASPTQVTHAMPKAYADGQVEFSFRWVAPATVGPAEFEIWTNAANDNSDAHDDSAAGIIANVAVGCDGFSYYLDADKDGHGEEATRIYSCQVIPDRITQGGDCDDINPAAHAGMTEVCNGVDDDCDGKVDQGFMQMLLVEDRDGDGYGARDGKTMIGCGPRPGFAPTFDDCDDMNPAVNPGATELINGIDDNCNNKLDEPPSASGGAPSVSGGAPSASGGASSTSGGASSMAGGAPQTSGGAPALGGMASTSGGAAPGLGGAPPSSAPSSAACAIGPRPARAPLGMSLLAAAVALAALCRRPRLGSPTETRARRHRASSSR